jgi:hypothetical protein
MFKILSTYICWKKYIKCNIWRLAVRPSYIWDARFLKVNAYINIIQRFVKTGTEYETIRNETVIDAKIHT